MAVFVEAVAEQTLSLETAAQLSSDEHTYFQALVALYLRDPQVKHHAIETALSETASALAEEMNKLLEQPAAVRFHAVGTWTAREIYCLIAYGEAEMFTSSYRGIFDRLIARMHQEALTGDELLRQVHDTRFRVFIKSAAVLNRLAMFLATIPSPVARWSLLTRCMSDLERAPDVTVQAVTAADEQGSTDIDDILRQRRVTPSVIVHRGHSTYVAWTLEKMPATAALVYLGNCGGYTLLETILRKAPKAHILTTKGIGTLTINDPLLGSVLKVEIVVSSKGLTINKTSAYGRHGVTHLHI